ncbi:hypothetical protein C2869_18285 [Saccharobesus litoralis]|uniref:Glutamate racemase n=1 Tax=Saccharobesus litoralis TaxID=2172099 RepID=A0A2S0VVV7_9ALTE|nr:hypothetical protein [Saccharobesus litoralis]AWB68240.1 hypothetical protein C2869_18285 [Saccharobesus litoralis]
MYDISFIHTGEIHKLTFENLIREYDHKLTTQHIVREDLLDHARKQGQDAVLQQKLQELVTHLSQESRLIICTCSSIAEFAEQLDGINQCAVQRIDREMADIAVQSGKKILIAAALASTIEPTLELLGNSADNLKQDCHYQSLVIEQAWPLFEQGDLAQYHTIIAQALQTVDKSIDLIVLAQASMAGASNLLKLPFPVLSSPRLGIERALATLGCLEV